MAGLPDGRYPAVMIGSSNGALTHLAAACGVPWLPQTVLVPVRRPRADPADMAVPSTSAPSMHGPCWMRNPESNCTTCTTPTKIL